MNTRVVPVGHGDYHRQHSGEDYRYRVSLDDDDATHTHDDIGHGFPCTLKQLLALRAQIDAAIAGQTPVLEEDDEEI